MQLVIVESPTKANTIKKFFDQHYKVVASYGHIRDLPKNEFGIEVENNFKPKYVVIPKARKTVQLLKKEVKKADLVILGPDPDREGEAIAWHLTQILNLSPSTDRLGPALLKKGDGLNGQKPYQRIVFHEITKPAIEESLKNPRKIDLSLVDSQQTRRILDRIVGYKLSPFLWKKVARRLSAGRVQSVAVRLVVEREREIQNFVPQEYWTIVASLLKIKNQKPSLAKRGEAGDETKSQRSSKIKNNEFEAILIKKDGKTIPKLGIKTKEEAEKIVKDLEDAEYKVTSVEKKEIKKNPFPPFTTSTLQQEAWQKFRFPAKFTMQIAQQLYEKGLTTYHRTDSLNLSDLSLFAAKKFIVKNYGKEYWPGFLRKYKTKTKGAQEAHEAIRPTYPENTPEKLSVKLEKNQVRLYDLIWRRFIACQMSQARFDSTKVEIEAKCKMKNEKGKIYEFQTNGSILKFDGFLKVYPIKYEETELPPLEIEEILKLIKLLPSQHFTQPPPRYTEASLIKALEQNGIGRPSTYAPILSTIQERNYVGKDENKKFRPTEMGIVVNDLLVNHFPEIVDIGFTAKMERGLDEIAEGKKNWLSIIKEFYDPFEKNLQKKYKEVSKKDFTEKPTNKICPKCGAPLLIRLGKYGKFYACSKFPKCKYTEPLEKNTLKIQCPKCKKGEIVEKRTKKGKIFYGCSNWPNCDFALWDKPTGEKCPKCGSLLVKTKRKQIRCSNKDCNYKIEK